jgi:pyrroline-5-carboxylate reductase
MTPCTIGFIGAGHIAGAMIQGMVGSGKIAPKQIGICDVLPARMERYANQGHPTFSSINHLMQTCPVVVLAVKPQNMEDVLPLVKEGLTPQTILVSVAAGVTAQRIKGMVGECNLILAMPNTPVELGQGAIALGRVEPTTAQQMEQVKGIFSTCALVEEIPHEKMPEIIAVNGSSPAFVYKMADIVAKQAADAGIDQGTALRLFCKTLIGSAEMMLRSGDPAALVAQVATPGGTTEAALAAMDAHGFEESLRAGMELCTSRAKELNQGK